MISILFKFGLICILLVQSAQAVVESNAQEGRAIAECLQHYGGITPDMGERLQRYKQWSETYEEIPCFTRCYLSKMFDIYNQTHGFQEENVVKKFGQPLYDACKERLMQGPTDTCESVYKGFHCLVSLENDPFVYIEGMQKLDTESKTAMKECLHRFDQYEWARLPEFQNFPVREPIPCFTKCFIDRLQLFSERTKQWNLVTMSSKLGVPNRGSRAQHCRALSRRRSRNSCAWMYQEFLCYALAK